MSLALLLKPTMVQLYIYEYIHIYYKAHNNHPTFETLKGKPLHVSGAQISQTPVDLTNSLWGNPERFRNGLRTQLRLVTLPTRIGNTMAYQMAVEALRRPRGLQKYIFFSLPS